MKTITFLFKMLLDIKPYYIVGRFVQGRGKCYKQQGSKN